MLKASPIDTISAMNAPHNGSVMSFDGRHYAVGLLWLTVQDDGDGGKALLQERLKKTKADFYCNRMHVSQQHGFGWLDKGHRRGMPVAAAMVADQLVGEWHGVFEADNGWWYVQVRSDTITPNGDRFFASEEDAFHVFQEEAQKNIWPHSYAPERWRLTDGNTRELPLRNVLDNLTTTILIPSSLTAFMGSAAVRNMVLASIGFCFLVMFGIVFHTLTKPPPVVEPVRVQPKKVIQTEPKKNLREIVSPIQLLRQCGEAADRLYEPLAGWVTERFTCSAGKASMTWMQKGGRLAAAREAGAKRWPQNALITVKDRQLTVTVSLAGLPKIDAPQLPTQESALLYLEQNLQNLGSLNVKPVVPRVPRTAATTRGAASNTASPSRSRSRSTAAESPVQDVQPAYLDIQFNTGFAPNHIGNLLDIPGMELGQMMWHVPQGVWQYDLKWIYDVPQVAKKDENDKNEQGNTTRTRRTRTAQEQPK